MKAASKIPLKGIHFRRFLKEEGSFPMLAIIMIGMLIFTGLAFMKWGADEGWEAMVEKARLQAYYAAHAGIMDIGFDRLSHLDPSTVPPQIPLPLGGETVTDAKGVPVATVENVWIKRSPNTLGEGLADASFLDVWAVGRVDFEDYQGNDVSVRDSLSLTVKSLSVSNFLYLTNLETTVFGEVIKFWSPDTLEGWVHSNDTIAIMQSPVFYDHVTTTAPIFWQGPGYNPIFVNYPPTFEYREIVLPEEATEIRNAASSSGLFFDDNFGQLAHRLVFYDQRGWVLYFWPMGEPFQDTVRASGPPPTWQAIFVDGYLELQGVVRGQVTVGAKGNPAILGKNCIRLMDDIRYWFADPVNGSFNDTTGGFTDILGIVSEGNITIGDTWANGRQNQVQGSSIIITAAMVALGESFSFEDQNEPDGVSPWEFWTSDYTCPIPPNSDERGDIFLWGGVTQYRRGYVHRSNHNGTGYDKEYHFDDRLEEMSPPFFIDATDSEGFAHYEIISWETR